MRHALEGGYGLVYVGQSFNPKPLDQTDLNKWRRLDLNGGGKLTFKVEADWWDPQASRPAGGTDRPHMAAPWGLLRWKASWSLLESSHGVYAAEFYNFL